VVPAKTREFALPIRSRAAAIAAPKPAALAAGGVPAKTREFALPISSFNKVVIVLVRRQKPAITTATGEAGTRAAPFAFPVKNSNSPVSAMGNKELRRGHATATDNGIIGDPASPIVSVPAAPVVTAVTINRPPTAATAT